MKVDIPTKRMVKIMVDSAIRKEMGRIDKILNRFRKRLIKIEEKIK